MTRIVQNLLASITVLAVGLLAAGALMFAFVESAQAHQAGARAVGSKLEVSIADSGRVIVRGAEVVEVSGDTLRARTEWGAAALTWTVQTDGGTDFVVKDGSGTDIDEIDVGDYVSFSGQLDGGSGTFTVDADVVKNWSASGDRNDHALRAQVKHEGRWGDWMRAFEWFKR